MEEKRSNGMIIDVDGFPESKGHAVILAIQHILAMFVACITVPMIVFSGYTTAAGQNLAQLLIAPTIVSAGIGTLFYLFMTKFKSPMFLASSFAYIGPMASAVAIGFTTTLKPNLWLLPVGMAMVGLVYVLIAVIIKFFGTAWLTKLLPPIVIGPVIMVIGLGLAGSAINNLNGTAAGDYNLLKILTGLVAMVATALCAHYGKKTISLIPFVIGMGAGYVFAAILTFIGMAANNTYMQIIDFAPIVNNFVDGAGNFRGFQAFLDYPKFLFLQGEVSQPLSWEGVAQAATLFIPVALVTICEHIGDHENMSGVIQKNLLEEPGLSRTLIGDGVATALSGVVCGAANTTYGENVAVVGVTKVASTKVIALACIFAIALGFISPLMAITQTIPACVTGGVSLILYGFIASSGVKMITVNKLDMGNTKNMFVASTILVAGIGGLAISFSIGSVNMSISATAVAMILGVCMNLILKDKPAEPAKEECCECCHCHEEAVEAAEEPKAE